ncbi:aminotransferase [Dietzia sp. HMSC21D01]|uniref:alanine transaminase n=1 Tax=Dietzia cinnamea TaxID=321318 RepID=A0AAW5Q2L0_9ACTN|nr:MULTISPECIES: pyridoxal phosphate-dependent aminotransferase [Dietzia]PWD96586.1 pyridoxal phosphate-dependent aminotransferase [Dietzia maris]MBM7231518.1 pyridoxal phosphate-dependent aminotransferase [Dietzia cinnamea]MCT1639596.1 pyridoxal phosphate-dependent aminotransferase [Dietzia cinnamea]MCT1863238.1 pyridoxal phosphate-dependent aminotransferase [Dietzia cinnamea]MCT2029845.1 pyridoxal phosphate-dependent aminotransferase [Dietzia cinnamea]
MQTYRQSRRLRDVRYDVRGPILTEAMRLEAEGHDVLRLNLGNMRPFGLDARPELVDAVARSLEDGQAYSDSRGIPAAREAVADYYRRCGVRGVSPADVFCGNGVSELITLVLQAMVDPGDEILVPAPDYPTWTGAVNLTGGVPVHYLADEANGWNPSLADIESKITPRTTALVMINPNNPTGAVYSEDTVRGMADIARRHGLVLLSDEIYEKLVFGDAVHHHAALAAGDDVLCLTFGGLSKAYRVCGYRAGWVVATGPLDRATDLLEGLTLLSNMRVCPGVPGQYAIPVALAEDSPWGPEVVDPDGRIERQLALTAERLNAIPGVSCVAPRGALYCFPRIDREMYGIDDDEEFVLDLLRSEHVLVTHGTGFNWPDPDHFRIVCLPEAGVLDRAIDAIARHLESRLMVAVS